MPKETTAFYHFLKQENQTGHFAQYASLASALQYAIPHAMTLSCVPRESSVLDWSCGNGHFSAFLTHHGYNTTGYSFEQKPTVLDRTSIFRFVAATPGENTRLPFPDASFDAVFSIGVLEHVHETGGAQLDSLKEIRRILRNGGLFLCFHLPAKGSWVEFLARQTARWHKKYCHTKLFTHEDVKTLCHNAGIEIQDYGRYNIFPRNCINLLPDFFEKDGAFATALHQIDYGAAKLLRPFTSQSYFIARKPA